MPKRIPDFKSDEEAAEFWDTHSLTDYLEDTEPADDVEFCIAPLKLISLRLPPELIASLKRIAQEKGIGYQTMARMWLMERARQEEAA